MAKPKIDPAILEQDLLRLRAALPPIWRNRWPDTEPVSDTMVAIDLEWDPETWELALIGVGNEHWVSQWWWQELEPDMRTAVWADLEALIRGRHVVYHNADADIRALRRAGFDVTVEMHKQLDDTMLAHSILHAEASNKLESLCESYGKLPPHKQLSTYAPSEYNAADVVETVLIWKHAIAPQLAADSQAAAVYRHMTLPFLSMAIEGEEAGIRVAQDKPGPLRAEFEEKIAQAEALAVSAVGPINLNSPKQMKVELYQVQNLPTQHLKGKPGEIGELTTNKDAIAALRRLTGVEWDPEELPTLETALANIAAGGNPLLEARYLHMGAQQALSHYVMPFYEDDRVTLRDRVYPECRQHVQSSGRHSYVGPALQQMRDKRLIAQITPDEGTVWVGHDWSNIEVWLLAYLAEDPLLLKAKAEGWDTHTVNYCDMLGYQHPPLLTKEVHTAPEAAGWRESMKWQGDEDLRRLFTKRFIFRLHYRGRPELAFDIPGARTLGFDGDRLVAASEAYLSKHQPIRTWWLKMEAQIDAEGLVRTFMGRPRRLTAEWKGARYREGCNHPMQGGVADIYVTTALLVKRAAPWARLVYGAHDSQWWQVPAERELEFSLLYAPIVTREFTINGQKASFPATFKRRVA